jgi:hypothetical protein
MKALRIIIILFVLSNLFISCTDLDDEQIENNNIENINGIDDQQGTGGEEDDVEEELDKDYS